MIFLTGSTGFLGRHLLRRLMELRPNEEFRLLVRAECKDSAKQRALSALKDACDDKLPAHAAQRIDAICGDLRAEHFGLPTTDFKELASGVNDFFHCAATTTLDLPYDIAWNVNVGGTKQIAELALLANERGNSGWLHHVSTAYVAGDTDRIIAANESPTERTFRNSYERTKAEAEAVIRSLQPGIPTTIYRPSIIVGDSHTGRTSAFNVMYLPTKLLLKGVCKAIPALPHTPFDVVPIDYVTDAIAHLSAQPTADGKCYHVSAGVGRESSPLEIIEALIGALDHYKQRRPKHLNKNPLICPDLITRAFFPISAAASSSMRQIEKLVTERIGVFKQLHPLIPYMLRNPRFDTSETEQALDGLLAPAPLFRSYADAVFRYCFETNWGRQTAVPLKPH